MASSIDFSNENIIEVSGIKKAFGEVIALKNAEFLLRKGSIHALCGGNGAGKSTFLSILMGFIQPDTGSIFINGKKMTFTHPKQAISAGIAIVQQELSLIPDLTVAENIYLGNEPKRFGFVDFITLNNQAQIHLNKLGFNTIQVTKKVRTLSVAEQQLVEIAKALSHTNANIIIMDEPTSAIGEEETQKLFTSLKNLANQGKGIIYVSHRLSEIFQIADSYTVFRDGSYICEGSINEISREKLIEHIVGTELDKEFIKNNRPENKILLSMKNINWDDKLQTINFQLRKGEILGIYGLVGSGRSEILDLIFGLQHPTSGEISLKSQILSKHTPQKAIQAGIAYCTEDRRDTGLILCRSINENINISSYPDICKFGLIQKNIGKSRAEEMIKQFNIKTPHQDQQVINLSGGNQQKVILGKWALLDPEIMLLDEPTRGIDVGAKREIYHFMSDFVSTGKGIIMVSSELAEIINMSDRVIVLKNGKISGILEQNEITQQNLMNLAV